MKKFKNYYKNEIKELRQTGKDFSKKNPALASFLSQEGQDPDVERLLEGTAFLTAKIQEKLDDDIPEFSKALVDILYPNYIRIIPSCSILKFNEGLNHTEVKISKHTNVQSSEINKKNLIFRTTYDVNIYPFDVDHVSYTTNKNSSILELTLNNKKNHKLSLESYDLNNLHIYINTEKENAGFTYYNLLQNQQKISAMLLDKNGEELLKVKLPPLKEMGIADNFELIPYPSNSFSGHRLMQEYFAFPNKFLFVNITGLSSLNTLDDNIKDLVYTIKIKIELNRDVKEFSYLTPDNLLLYCTPIINIFNDDSVPIRKNKYKDEYLIQSSTDVDSTYEIFELVSVAGRTTKYNTFESFLYEINNTTESYKLIQKTNLINNKLKSYIKFISTNTEFAEDIISCEVLVTNGDDPCELLMGDINKCYGNMDETLSFSNVLIPTKKQSPPIHNNFMWRVISNLSLNFMSITDIDTFKSTLRTYDFPGVNDENINKQTAIKLDSILSIETQNKQLFFNGMPLYGVETMIKIDDSAWSNIGDVFLFCNVLNEFLSAYCSINSFNVTTVELTSGKIFKWKEKQGLGL